MQRHTIAGKAASNEPAASTADNSTSLKPYKRSSADEPNKDNEGTLALSRPATVVRTLESDC